MENQPQRNQNLSKYTKTLNGVFFIHVILMICKLVNPTFIQKEYLETIFAVMFVVMLLLFLLMFRENWIHNKENTIRNMKKISKMFLARILFFGGLFAVLYYLFHKD